MKVFIVTTTADITPEDIQDYIWMNVDGGFSLKVQEFTGVKHDTIN